MAYADLTQQQKDVLQGMIIWLRQWTGEQARTNNHGDLINTMYNSEVSAILGELAADDVIPNLDIAQYAGSDSLTKDEVIGVVSHIQGILTGYNSAAHRQMWIRACGPGGFAG